MNVPALIIVGLSVGLAGGMFGIGGGIVLIPALNELLGPDQHRYQAAAMIVNLFVAVPAVIQHRRAKAIDAVTVMRLLPLAAAAVVAGVAVSEMGVFAGSGEAYLRGLFGLFLFFCAALEGYRLLRPRAPSAGVAEQTVVSTRLRWPLAAMVAVPTGLSAGLLGVGGGIVAVPLQRWLLRIPMRKAIANSAAVIIATALIGAITKNWAYAADNQGSFDAIVLAAIFVPTAVAGSLVGARMTHRLPLRVLKGLFILLLMVAAARLVYGAARSLPKASLEPDVVALPRGETISNRSSLRFGPAPPNWWYSSPTRVNPAAA